MSAQLDPAVSTTRCRVRAGDLAVSLPPLALSLSLSLSLARQRFLPRDRCYAHLHASLNIPRAKHCATRAAQLEQNGRCIDIYGSLPCAPKVYGRDFFPILRKTERFVACACLVRFAYPLIKFIGLMAARFFFIFTSMVCICAYRVSCKKSRQRNENFEWVI